MHKLRHLLVSVLIFTAFATPAGAQPAQGRPIRLVVGFPAGGPTDILARMLAQNMTEGLGNQVIVDNRAGASGNIAAEAVARSAADGQTLLLAVISFVINPSLYGKVGYDPVKDFAPVALVASTPYFILIHPSVPARNIKELLVLAKARPGALNYSSAGSGSGSHLAAELFKSTAGVNITHIPYRGAAPAMIDLLAGEVSLQFNNPLTALPHVKSGRVRALAVMSVNRSAAAPQVPTLAESGVSGGEVGSWSAVLASAGTPVATIARLHQEIVRILGMQEARSRLLAEGAEPIGAGPDELAAFIKTELVRWAKVVSQSGARLD